MSLANNLPGWDVSTVDQGPEGLPKTVGELKVSGYQFRSVKEELRQNLFDRLKSDQVIFPGIVGYDQSVIPQLINGLLARHDLLFLGLRGQAKTRLLRALPHLLDEYIPTLEGQELLDNPLAPALKSGQALVEQLGDDAPIRWVHRSQRYHEKLATPDVTIADLIGEIDLVKHAEGKYLSDETTMHFGLVPRTNRGIFAINELPDLAPRIQVGLFNVLEERDVQIRGYPVRLPLDLLMVFSANPEDYTNRGRIVTPLKDRIGTVIRTHYPQTVKEAMVITTSNAYLQRDGALDLSIPPFMHEVVEQVVRLARKSPHINQASGVSVRTSIATAELMVSNAERRGIINAETQIVPRICDLAHISAGCRGKIELMLAEEDGAEDKLVFTLLGEAVKDVFEKYADLDDYEDLIEQFRGGANFQVGDEISSETLVASLNQIKGLKSASTQLCRTLELNPKQPAELACAAELLLEALYVNNQLSKYVYKGQTHYKK